MNNNTTIELYEKLQDPLQAIDRIGEFFAKSAMFGCDRAEQGKVLAMICLAEKKSPVAITRDYDIVDGKLRKKALASLADFRKAGGKHRWIKTGDDGKEAVLELTYDGQTITSKFSIEDAQKQGLVRPRSNWEKAPGNMLRARAISNGVAMICPEIFAGEEPVDITPAEPAAMNLATVAPPEKPKPSEVVVDVQTVDDEKAEAEAGLAPVQTTPPAPVKQEEPPKQEFKPGPTYATPAGTRLPDEMIGKLEEAIGQHAIAAVNWMLKEGWLQKGQDLGCLTAARAKRIIAQRDSFLRAISGGAK